MSACCQALAAALVLLTGCAHAPPTASSSGPFRRVVTGLDSAGRSVIVEDGAVPEGARMSAASFDASLLAQAPFLRFVLESDGIWGGALPLPAGAPDDPLRGPSLGSDDGLTPNLPKGGFAAAMVRWAPGGPSFPMHDSPTVDLIAVISGALELQLEAGSTVLRAGDVAVQRGTKHTWKVLGEEPCVAFVVLLDATGRATTSGKAAAR